MGLGESGVGMEWIAVATQRGDFEIAAGDLLEKRLGFFVIGQQGVNRDMRVTGPRASAEFDGFHADGNEKIESFLKRLAI